MVAPRAAPQKKSLDVLELRAAHDYAVLRQPLSTRTITNMLSFLILAGAASFIAVLIWRVSVRISARQFQNAPLSSRWIQEHRGGGGRE